MLVTIITDASFYKEHNVGAWACYIISNRGKLVKSDSFKTKIETPQVAELCAVVKGLYFALKEKLAQNGDTIMLQTDCLYVIHLINKLHKPKRDLEKQALQFLFSWQAKYNLIYKTKHVKGHSSKKEPRFWANNLVDRLAKKAALNEIKNQDKILTPKQIFTLKE
jgi:ribonuclease HI